jgi:hypothetical protein
VRPVFLLLFLSFHGALFGQVLSVGVKSGVRLTGALDPDADNLDESRSYAVGPMVELHLPL